MKDKKKKEKKGREKSGAQKPIAKTLESLNLNNINTNINTIIEKGQQQVAKINTKTNLRLFFMLFTMIGITVAFGISVGISWILEYIFGENLFISPMWWVLIFSILFGWILAFITGLFFLNPFIKLGAAMKRVAKGDFSIRLQSKSVFKVIREIYGSFNLMTEELGMTEIVQTDFVSNVSHEIKTPINAIEGYATLLQNSPQSDAERDICVEKILFNTGRLSELVSNILLISKIENQAIQSQGTLFRLDEQIRQSIVVLEPKWDKKNIELDLELESIEFVGNQGLLHHVWDNLIDNAIKFSPEGAEIKVRLAREGERIAFSVSDSGEGIDEKIKEHIFDKFFQGDSSHKSEGNGLGLALVKKIADMHGGSVSAENIDGGGCMFTVILPTK